MEYNNAEIRLLTVSRRLFATILAACIFPFTAFSAGDGPITLSFNYQQLEDMTSAKIAATNNTAGSLERQKFAARFQCADGSVDTIYGEIPFTLPANAKDVPLGEYFVCISGRGVTAHSAFFGDTAEPNEGSAAIQEVTPGGGNTAIFYIECGDGKTEQVTVRLEGTGKNGYFAYDTSGGIKGTLGGKNLNYEDDSLGRTICGTSPPPKAPFIDELKQHFLREHLKDVAPVQDRKTAPMGKTG